MEFEGREYQLELVQEAHKALKESIQEKHGIDADAIEWKNPKFSWKSLEKATGMSLRESGVNSASSLGQLFRYGIQQFMFDAYRNVPVVYPDIVQIRPSGNRQEWYAPLFGTEPPSEVAPSGPFKDSRIQGLDMTLINKKVGRLLSIQRELFEDDQTGQIASRPTDLGKKMRYREEFDVMSAVRGATYTTAIGNRPASYAGLTQATLEAADIALMAIRDPLGNRMLVMPNLLLVSTGDKFNAAKLLNSTLQPSVPGAAGQTHDTASSGTTGYVMTVNPLQGLYQLAVSRFLLTGDWFLMESRTSIPFQERMALELMQENPQSGQSFDRDEYRWRVARRYQTAVIESRFLFAGQLIAGTLSI